MEAGVLLGPNHGITGQDHGKRCDYGVGRTGAAALCAHPGVDLRGAHPGGGALEYNEGHSKSDSHDSVLCCLYLPSNSMR